MTPVAGSIAPRGTTRSASALMYSLWPPQAGLTPRKQRAPPT